MVLSARVTGLLKLVQTLFSSWQTLVLATIAAIFSTASYYPCSFLPRAVPDFSLTTHLPTGSLLLLLGGFGQLSSLDVLIWLLPVLTFLMLMLHGEGASKRLK